MNIIRMVSTLGFLVVKYALILVFFLSLSGCSTFVTKSGDDSEWGTPFSGTKASPGHGSNMLEKARGHLPAFLITYAFVIVDFVASFGADIILLPADLTVAATELGGDSGEEQENDAQE